MKYNEWLEELVAERGGEPITRREYYSTRFNNIDMEKIYEQDENVTKLLYKRGAINEN